MSLGKKLAADRKLAGFTQQQLGDELNLSPQAISKFNRMSGSMDIPRGTVSVSYKKIGGDVKFNIFIPEGCKASFRIPSYACALHPGKNEFSVLQECPGDKT